MSESYGWRVQILRDETRLYSTLHLLRAEAEAWASELRHDIERRYSEGIC